MKRLYFLVAVASLQIIIGSLTLLGAAQPVRMSQDAFVPTGNYYHFEFGILGAGQVVGNVSELQGRSFDLLVFDDGGYASFRDGTNAVPPLFDQAGTSVRFDLSLPGSRQYHVVAVDLPARQELRLHLDLVVVGLETRGAIVAIIVLVGGLALVGASLMLSVWAWRRALQTRNVSPGSAVDPIAVPPADPSPDPQEPPQDSVDDNTRIY